MGISAFLAVLVITSIPLVIVEGESHLADLTNGEIGERRVKRTKNVTKCDIYTGKWVYDSSYPLYDAGECPFIEGQFNCETNGRKDKNYQKFNWRPSHCLLPRLDGVRYLKLLRGKRIMFVGDSISLNQWQSLICILHTATPNSLYTMTRTGSLSEFTFLDYNTSLILKRDGFLVKLENDMRLGRILDLNSVSYGKSLKGTDILLFNSWHWWLHTGKKQLWDYIKIGNKLYEDMDRLKAYEKGLRTWAKWVDKHLDTSQTKVFFQAISPDHFDALDTKAANGRTCVGLTQPEPRQDTENHPGEEILEKVIGKMKRPVNLLRITKLSQIRRDGHPGIYGIGKDGIPDCTHWCLPGVPDTWNHLLYSFLVDSTRFG